MSDEVEELLSIIKKVNTAPTFPSTEMTKLRFTALNDELRNSEVRAYIEANFGIKALELVQTIISKFI